MEVGLYQTKRYTAYFYPQKIVIETSRQAFKIRHATFKKTCVELMELRQLIESGKIETLDNLLDYNGLLVYETTSTPCLI